MPDVGWLPVFHTSYTHHVTNKTLGYRNTTKTWARPGVQAGIRTLAPLLHLCCTGPFHQRLLPSLISERMNRIFWVRETKFQKGWDVKDSCHLGPEGGDSLRGISASFWGLGGRS